MRDLTKRSELDRQLQLAGAGKQVHFEQLDVSDPHSIESAVSALDLKTRPPDAIVHNAGVAVGGAFEDLTDAHIRKVMDVNFFGVLALTQRLLPAFRAQRRGRIVVVSSESAF